MPEGNFHTEYLELRKLFDSPEKYEVPPNNRDYAWTEKNEVQDFWDDLKESLSSRSEHFFGSIFLLDKKGHKKILEILDGQQRLATVTILLSAIRNTFYNLGDRTRMDLTNRYIVSEKEMATLRSTLRLTLNKRNKEFFKSCIQLPMGESKTFDDYCGGQKLSSSNQSIKNAYDFFIKKIQEDHQGKNQDEKIKHLFEIFDHLLDKFTIIKTVVEDYDEAYMLFESINWRGLELSIADLFRNYSIGKSPEDERENVIDIWEEMSTLLENVSLKVFLRHYWASTKANIPEKQIYKAFKNHLKQKDINTITFIL